MLRRAPLLAQLVIVSNRVAIPEKNAKARAGGLEVAVKAALKHKSGIWFGWSGKVSTRTKIATQQVVHDGIIEDDHHAIASIAFEGAAILDDEFADGRMVVAQ